MEKIGLDLNKRRAIFYHPLPLDPDAVSASGIRPVKILKALENAGYIIDKIVGFSVDRARAFRNIKENVQSGIHYDFVYGESSTMPSELTDPGHFPRRPFLDLRFLMFCKRKHIPVGIFYRDIYWRFPDYKNKVPRVKRQIAHFFYLYNLLQYRVYLKKLFVPSIEMTEYLPGRLRADLYQTLPPAHDNAYKVMRPHISRLALLYVGGVGNHYRLDLLIAVVSKFSKISLTICTRKNEWTVFRKDLSKNSLTDNISIEHLSGMQLDTLYDQHSIGVLFVQPVIYWKFAVPYKLYEYIGYGLPVIASKGTLVGEIVESLDIGWCVEYSSGGLHNLLQKLQKYPEMIDDKVKSIEALRHLHTWDHRVAEIEQALIG